MTATVVRGEAAAEASAGPAGTPPWDGGRLLMIYAALLIVLPSRLVLAPFGGAGQPAALLGLGCLGWWLWHHVSRPLPTGEGRQPVRTGFLLFAGAAAASFVAATVRPIEAQEYSSGTLAMVMLASLGGVLLLANDGIPDHDRLLKVTRVLVLLGAALSLLGIVQFLTGQVLVDRITIPGLSSNHSTFGLTVREGFTRPAGTATHPIEYGAVVTMILPLALALAVADTARGKLVRWAPVAVMLFCVPLSISRSALVSCAVGLLIMLVSWPPALRWISLASLLAFGVGVFLFIPGMLGSLVGLFTNVGTDSSAASRTGSYGIAAEFVERSPVFGRGLLTFLPSYRILDNQYLGLLIETGFVGLGCFLGLIVAALVTARRAGRGSRDLLGAQLGRGLLASVASGAITLALFDGLSFPMAAGTFFLLLGMAGAARRVLPPRVPPAQPGLATWEMLLMLRRRWYAAVAGAALTLGAVVLVTAHPGVYTTQANVLFLAPKTPARPNALESTTSSVIATAGLVERLVNSGVEPPATSSLVTLVGRGVRDGTSVELPNSGGQWAQNFDTPVLRLQVTGSSAESVAQRFAQLHERVSSTAARLQSARGAQAPSLIGTRLSPAVPPMLYEAGHRKVAVLVTTALGGCLTLLLVYLIDALGPRLAARLRRRGTATRTGGFAVQDAATGDRASGFVFP